MYANWEYFLKVEKLEKRVMDYLYQFLRKNYFNEIKSLTFLSIKIGDT